MELTQFQLENGLRVIMHSNNTAPVVACNVWVGVGSADEEPREAGLAHVHEHMLFKGTARRGVGEIAREVESAGGHINAFTSFDQTCYYVVMSSRYFDTGLDILSDAIRNSSFDEEELERELEVIQEEIKRGKDDPHRTTALKLYETAYRVHPYRLPVIGNEESVDSFKREDVLSFFHKHYRPSNMTLVLVGDFEEEQARALVEEHFGDFEGERYEDGERPLEPSQEAWRGALIAEDNQEAHLLVGFHIPPMTHEDIPALDLLSAVLGYGDASHLYQEIQRKREMVNSVYASTSTAREPGLFYVGADYQLEDDQDLSDEEILESILTEVFHFREFLVDETELVRARTLIESQQIYGKETVERYAMRLGRQQMIAGDPRYEELYYERLAEVTVQDLREVARRYLSVDQASVVLNYPGEEGDLAVEALKTATQAAFDAAVARARAPGPVLDDQNFYRLELEGGPTLVVQEDHSVETFSMRCLMPGGLVAENRENNGITSLLASMLTQGMMRRSSVEISRSVESMAGYLSGMSGRNSFGISMKGLVRHFEPCFALAAECLFESVLPPDEFERERKMQLQGIRGSRDHVSHVNWESFLEAFFGEHPYGMLADGSEESVAGLIVEAARAQLEALVQPEDMILVVVGDVDTSRVVEQARVLFQRQASAEPLDRSRPALEVKDRPRLVRTTMNKEQAHLTFGFPGAPIEGEDRFTQAVLYAILSGQGGRLFYELRDRQSLAYSVYASALVGLGVGTFTVNIGTSPEKIDQALEGIVQEIDRLKQDAVTDDELSRAKRYLIGNHDIGLQGNGTRAMTVALDELYGMGHRNMLRYGERIESVSKADIERYTERYLDLDQAVVSVTSPEDTEFSWEFPES